tara:strand:+ start:1049 stop:2866 length:1818 start_codon:yes stop_codon:yes gene_type:complete
MCGISGYFGSRTIRNNKIAATLRLMKNRGPDNQSKFIRNKKGKNLYFLHSRLSIFDTKSRSNQPFVFKNLLMIFNGEIYNFLELKKELIKLNYTFKTSSDTEVLLKYYYHFKEKSFDKFEGMWALAIFDLKKNNLILSRDRFGEKPLYYIKDENGIYFGSETKFLRSIYSKKIKINKQKCIDFLSLGWNSICMNNNTFFHKITSLTPSYNLKINKNLRLTRNQYWSLKKIKKIKNLNTQKLKKAFINSIKLRLRSDVKLASYLSSGLDSNSIYFVAKKIFKKKLLTFSVFNEKDKYDESKLIKKNTKENKIKNFNLNLKDFNIFKELRSLINYYDAPVLTLNNLAQSLLCKEINKSKIKVVLNGTGSDEVFAGYYDHYRHYLMDLKNNHKNEFHKNYKIFRKKVKPIIKNDLLLNIDKKFAYSRLNIIKNYNFLLKNKPIKYYLSKKILFKSRLKTTLFRQLKESLYPELYFEDLNSMKYSVESRTPFLDRNFVETLFQLDTKYFMKNGYSKYLLRKIMQGILPNKILDERKKIGFNLSVNTFKDFNKENFLRYLIKNKKYIKIFFKFNFLINYFKSKNFKEIDSEDNKFIFRIVSLNEFIKLQY